MRFLLTGQMTFENRGCEAIVRSTVSLLRAEFPGCEVLVPSTKPEWDIGQWPEYADLGVKFVDGYFPGVSKYWRHIQRLPFDALKRVAWPFAIDRHFLHDMRSCDAVLSIGGDNYSLDYDIPSLYVGTDAAALRLRKPVVLWGASVGPFEDQPAYVPVMRSHLRRLALIGARETYSFDYLTEKLRLQNVARMADPAFGLEPESPRDGRTLSAFSNRDTLGLNISPLISHRAGGREVLIREVSSFVRSVVAAYEMDVVLIPHVMPSAGDSRSSDLTLLRHILETAGGASDRLSLVDQNLNAAELKYVIGRCTYFMGARTHSTIAALSSGVPTVSIAYSVKARGIKQDLLGTQDAVLSSASVTAGSLDLKLRYLIENAGLLRTLLRSRVPVMKELARGAMSLVGKAIGD